MQNHIGGLFETQENANLAYEALERSGFTREGIHTLIHRPRNRTLRATEVRIQDIAKNAFAGALILGTIGGFIGFLVGTGTFSLPYLEPGSAPREPLFVFMSVVWGVVAGGLTGILLGAASRLLRSREKAEVMTEEIDKNGVIVAVHVDGQESEAKARRVLEEHRALEVGRLQEKWDLNIWVSPNENEQPPSMARIRQS